jgi:hypothetical protein
MEATVGQVRTAPHELHPPFLTHPTIAPSLARKISVARPTDALTTRVCGAVDMRVGAHRRVGAVPIWVGAPVDVRSHQEHQVEPPSPASSCHPLVHRMLHALPAAARWFGRMPKVVRISSLPRGPWLRRSRSLLVRRRTSNQSHDCRERVSLSGLNGPPEKPHAGSAYSQPTQPTLSTQAALSKDAARGGPRPVVNNRSGLSREPHCAALRRPFCVRLNRSTCGCQGCCGGPRGAADASREGRGREAGQGVHRRAEPRHAARVRCKP